MNRTTRLIAATLLLASATAALPALAQDAESTAAALTYSNKWRLEVSEGANNDGVIQFRVTPKDGTAVEIPVALKHGRGENGCARDIRDAFEQALDKSVYHVETDDGEDVLVKVRKGPDIAIELVESTVKGTRVHLQRE